MSSWTPAGNDFTLERESASHVSVFIPLAHAHIGISRIERQTMAEGWAGGAVAATSRRAHGPGSSTGCSRATSCPWISEVRPWGRPEDGRIAAIGSAYQIGRAHV